MATITVLLFSVLRDRVGEGVLHIEVDTPTTGTAVLDQLEREFPVVASFRGVLRLAVNRTYVHEGEMVAAGDEVALITPVSGG